MGERGRSARTTITTIIININNHKKDSGEFGASIYKFAIHLHMRGASYHSDVPSQLLDRTSKLQNYQQIHEKDNQACNESEAGRKKNKLIHQYRHSIGKARFLFSSRKPIDCS